MGERVVNIQDLIIEILLHWRCIILCMFVGGIISGIFGYANFRQSSEAARKEQLENTGVSELQSEMTQKELAEVEQVLLNEESLKKWNSYIQNSVLMRLDSSQVYQEDLIYTVIADGIQSDLIGVYVNLLTTNELYQFIADRTDGFSVSDIQELITVINIGTASNQRNNSFNITILAESKEVCATISEALKSYIEEKYRSISEIYGVHNIVLLQEHIADVDSMSLLQKQIDARSKVISLQTETASLKDIFSEKQRWYYQLRANEANSGSENLTEEANSTNVIGLSFGLSAGIKNAVWGMFFAVLIYVLAIFFLYVLDDRLRYTDNCATIYHVPALGHIPADRTARTLFKGIDQKLYLLRDKRHYTSPGDEAVRLSVAAITMVSQRKGIHGICGVSGSMSSKVIEEIRKGLKADNIELQSAENILYNADSLNLLNNVQAAVLVEKAGAISYGEIQQELEILRRQGIDILGMVIVE